MSGPVEPTFDLVFQDAWIFDGERTLPKPTSVGITDGRIAKISQSHLSGRQTVNAAGLWLTPGLIESHIHLFDFQNAINPEAMGHYIKEELPKNLRSFLDYGITSVKSVGDPLPEIGDVRNRLASGDLSGPRLLMTGVGITAPGGHPSATVYGRNPWYRLRAASEIGSVDEARDVVNAMAEKGVDAIKLLLQGGCRCSGEPDYKWHGMVSIQRMKPEVLEAAVAEARRLGFKTTVHTFEEERAIEALEAGADGVEHGVVATRISDKRFIDLLLKNDASYVPTLWVYPRAEAMHNLALVRDAGVRIVLGSDSFAPTVQIEGLESGMFGANSIVEAERMALSGLTATEILRSATGLAAVHLGRSDIGVIAEGRQADLLLLQADPTVSVENLKSPLKVIQGGRIVVDRAEQQA
ncbi:amidohydrolase family protein [Sphingobium indicum BiD32]|uniref:Amidohydrolase family protein n=1 Tax=Sphingobium indicum BiD32 TaxID=1301087 RepID=N1MLF9_9SPHN|nr:amidohydrolase family protein [Sphingobium indicum]CCW17791.1 amidohydrolase family protein [Sphingobium indicum BiD32]